MDNTAHPSRSGPSGPSEPPANEDSLNKIKRVQRACLACRKRKSRCHLQPSGETPCIRCKRENLECVLGGSNRGGRRIRKTHSLPQHSLPNTSPLSPEDHTSTSTFHGLGTVGTVGAWSPAGQRHSAPDADRDLRSRSEHISNSTSAPHSREPSESPPDEIQFPTLQNPSDALGILAQVAETSHGDGGVVRRAQGHMASTAPIATSVATETPISGIQYPLVDEQKLTVRQVEDLVKRYHQHYHPYYPLAPPQTFDIAQLPRLAIEEPHLLTAILVISSKDLTEEPMIYDACASHMKMLVSNLAAGGEADVEAVEALLLLAEWAPYTQRGSSGQVGRGEEDKECWMHVGLALRLGYFLGLDRYSFRVDDDGKDKQFNRKKLIWTACYMSDRQISIRVGKAFWSRGPGPLTTLRREDYPSLLPSNPNAEDYASIFQATLELVQLFSNVHDVLYSNPGASFRSHLSGGYIKFIDDFRSAIYGWKSVWGTLTCSPYLKATLLMTYDYLRLYTNAFAFQATVRRKLHAQDNGTTLAPADYQSPSRVFYNNVASVGDARFIYEGLDAAKAILTTANNFVDPERSLRYMPLRFYLYLVYAGVFLYRARCVGVMGGEEERAIRLMIQETVARLQRSSIGTQHLGSRYAQLLKLLWQKAAGLPKEHVRRHPSLRGGLQDLPPPPPAGLQPHHHQHHHHHQQQQPQQQQQQQQQHPTPPRTLSSSHTGGTGADVESPSALTEQLGDFNWTDLMAVGEFAMHGNPPGYHATEEALWSGFLPIDMGAMGGAGAGGNGAPGGGGWTAAAAAADPAPYDPGDIQGMAF